MTIWERVTTALTPLGCPMGSGTYIVASGANIPDRYLAYFVVDITPEEHADDRETLRSYLVQISIYDRAGLIGLPDVIGAMVAADFTFVDGRQLEYDDDTKHHGIAFDFEYLETLD